MPTSNNDNRQSHAFKHAWRTFKAVLKYADLLSHHTLAFLAKSLLVVYILFAALILVLRFVVLPQAAHYKPEIEQFVSQKLDRPVTIGQIDASWNGLNPTLSLRNVQIKDTHDRTVLALPDVSASLPWWSIPFAELRLDALTLTRPELTVSRSTSDEISIAGIPLKKESSDDHPALNWLLNQKHLRIRNGTLHWIDRLRNAPELTLTALELHLENGWKNHRLSLQSTPPAALSGPIDFRMDFNTPSFSKNSAEFSKWKGSSYIALGQTDLPAIGRYVDWPIDITRGNGSLRLWLNFDAQKPVGIKSDFKLNDFVARLQDGLPPLDFKFISGGLTLKNILRTSANNPAQADTAPSQLFELRNFTFQTRQEAQVDSTSLNVRFMPKSQHFPQRLDIETTALDLNTFSDILKRIPLPDSITQWTSAFTISGKIPHLTASLEDEPTHPVSYELQARFNNLSLHRTVTDAHGDALFDNLSGNVDLTQQRGKLSLDSTNAALHITDFSPDQRIELHKLQALFSWQFDPSRGARYNLENLLLSFGDSTLTAQGSYRLNAKAPNAQDPGTLQLKAHLSKLDVRQLRNFLPNAISKDLHFWLSNAFEYGTAENVDLVLDGNLKQFPFDAPPGKTPPGKFTVTGQIVDGRLNYAPDRRAPDGVHPLWPQAEHIQGRFVFDRERMDIFAKTASTLGVPLKNIHAVIPDLGHHDPQLSITGYGNGPFQDFLNYVNASPVYGWIDHFTEHTQGTGAANLKLELFLPLDRLHDSKVAGTVQFMGNDVLLLQDLPQLNHTTGSLSFSEHGFTLNDMRTIFLGGQSTVAGGMCADKTIKITGSGFITPAGLKQEYANPTLSRLIDHIEGRTSYRLAVNVAHGLPEVVVESDLRGLTMNLPGPFGKTADTPLKVNFRLNELPSATSSLAQDEFRISLGTLANAYYRRSGDTTIPNSHWQVLSAGIGVNSNAPRPASGLAFNIDLPEITLDPWARFFADLFSNEGNTTPEHPPGSSQNIVAQYLIPNQVALRTNKLDLYGQKITHLVMGATVRKKGIDMNIGADQASGYLQWANPSKQHPHGRITAHFADLELVRDTTTAMPGLLCSREKISALPELDIDADDFRLYGIQLGKLSLIAKNIQTVNGLKWQIQTLKLSNPDASLEASGSWLDDDTRNETTLDYVLNVDNAGQLLDRLKFPGILANGQGTLSGTLHWAGSPFSFDIPSLSSQLKLDVKAGRFLKAEPGAAKLIGILSMQSLPQLLRLDFQDVFSHGFAFSTVLATAKLEKGAISSQDFKMSSPNATVLIEGSSDLHKENQDIQVAILPNINAGAVSVIYALAVNPVIGIGTFLAQLFLNYPLAKAFTFGYHITGTWAHPVITKVDLHHTKD